MTVLHFVITQQQLLLHKKNINLFNHFVMTGTTTQDGHIIFIINLVQLHSAVLKYICVTMSRNYSVRIFIVQCILCVVENTSVI